ncbi:MAG TPA: hypothetical protein VHY32_06840 [Caulobacteraceae bacterium]|jgi:hypothetical protein|nr:hypothetical protein [Caulobacteraceae bacterium]
MAAPHQHHAGAARSMPVALGQSSGLGQRGPALNAKPQSPTPQGYRRYTAQALFDAIGEAVSAGPVEAVLAA